jgi:hypothetical protein
MNTTDGEVCKLHLGEGGEGVVMRIGENLVQKKWKNPFFTSSGDPDTNTSEAVLLRFERVQKAIDLLPRSYRERVRMPEFVGYEGSRAGVGTSGDLVTYHEYVDGGVFDGGVFVGNLPDDFRAMLGRVFIDAWGDNIRVDVKGIICLVDVAVTPEALSALENRTILVDKYAEEWYTLEWEVKPDDEDLAAYFVVDPTDV